MTVEVEAAATDAIEAICQIVAVVEATEVETTDITTPAETEATEATIPVQIIMQVVATLVIVSVATTSSLSLTSCAKIDTLEDDLLQHTIKVFFDFLDHCICKILKGNSFSLIANVLNIYF